MNCPMCGRKSKPMPGGLFRCPVHGFHDSDPDEGGSYSDRNPAARLERDERRNQRPKRNHK